MSWVHISEDVFPHGSETCFQQEEAEAFSVELTQTADALITASAAQWRHSAASCAHLDRLHTKPQTTQEWWETQMELASRFFPLRLKTKTRAVEWRKWFNVSWHEAQQKQTKLVQRLILSAREAPGPSWSYGLLPKSSSHVISSHCLQNEPTSSLLHHCALFVCSS